MRRALLPILILLLIISIYSIVTSHLTARSEASYLEELQNDPDMPVKEKMLNLIAYMLREDNLSNTAREYFKKYTPEEKTEVLDGIIMLLDSNDESNRILALNTINETGFTGYSIKLLTPFISDPNPKVRADAILTIANMLDSREIDITLFTEKLNDSDANVRHAAIYALTKLGENAGPAQEDVEPFLKGNDSYMKAMSILMLSNLNTDTTEFLDVLLLSSKDEDPFVRRNAYAAMRKIDEVNDSIITAFIIGLNDPEKWVEFYSAQGLGNADTLPDKALPKLIEMLSSKDSDLRLASLSAITRHQVVNDEVYTAIERLTNDDNEIVRGLAGAYIALLDKLRK